MSVTTRRPAHSASPTDIHQLRHHHHPASSTYLSRRSSCGWRSEVVAARGTGCSRCRCLWSDRPPRRPQQPSWNPADCWRCLEGITSLFAPPPPLGFAFASVSLSPQIPRYLSRSFFLSLSVLNLLLLSLAMELGLPARCFGIVCVCLLLTLSHPVPPSLGCAWARALRLSGWWWGKTEPGNSAVKFGAMRPTKLYQLSPIFLRSLRR